MLKLIVENSLVHLIALIVLASLGCIFRNVLFSNLRKLIISKITKGSLKDVLTYRDSIKVIEKCFKESNNYSTIKFLCFVFKDLVDEKQISFFDQITQFLKIGGSVQVLLIKPESKYLEQRAEDLNINKEILISHLKTSISYIKNELLTRYPHQIKIAMYDNLPLFRLNFIGDTLVIGLYNKNRSYSNVFYQIDRNSPLFQSFNKMFEYYSINADQIV